jgi:hypothetical protein
MTTRTLTLTATIDIDATLYAEADHIAWPDGSTEATAMFDEARTAIHNAVLDALNHLNPVFTDNPTFLLAPAAPAKPYGITAPDATYDITTWNIVGDLRRNDNDDANYDANYDARDDLAPTWTNIEFDPETSCFYAYAQTEAEANEFAAALDTWLNTRRGAKS